MPSSEDAETCICIASINEYFIRQAALNVKLQQKASPISVKPDEKSRKNEMYAFFGILVDKTVEN